MNMHSTPPSNVRRWLLPLVILLAAGALMLWGSQRETQRMEEVRQMVKALCRDVAAGRDVSGRLNAGSAVGQGALPILQSICPSPDAIEDLDIVVTPGDIDMGTATGQATHTAILRSGNVDLLGLRVQHRGKNQPITIIGYWLPQSD